MSHYRHASLYTAHNRHPLCVVRYVSEFAARWVHVHIYICRKRYTSESVCLDLTAKTEQADLGCIYDVLDQDTSIWVHMVVLYIHVCVYIYIYIERERGRTVTDIHMAYIHMLYMLCVTAMQRVCCPELDCAAQTADCLFMFVRRVTK